MTDKEMHDQVLVAIHMLEKRMDEAFRNLEMRLQTLDTRLSITQMAVSTLTDLVNDAMRKLRERVDKLESS
jgi:hypothetical protein